MRIVIRILVLSSVLLGGPASAVFTDGLGCQDTKTVTVTFTYNFELKVQP